MLSWTEIMIIAVLLILLFGRGKISDLMGDVAQGIKSFKKGLADEDEAASSKKADTTATIEHQPSEKVNVAEPAAQSERKAS